MEVTGEALARFFDVVLPHLNEVQRRVVAGASAEMLGRGGKTAVAAASGMSRNTVIKAEAEVAAGIEPSARLRAAGGGDKPLTDKQPGLLTALDELVDPATRGNPMPERSRCPARLRKPSFRAWRSRRATIEFSTPPALLQSFVQREIVHPRVDETQIRWTKRKYAGRIVRT